MTTTPSAASKNDPVGGATLQETPWQWWRNQMPIVGQWAYFDHAAVAPIPQRTVNTLVRLAEQAASQGDTVWLQWSEDLQRLRSGVACWLHAEAEEIALVPNTTFGINLVAEGFPWRSGDNVVIPGGEFPSNQFPWRNQAHRGVELRVVPSPAGRVDLDGLRRAIDGRTRVVAASWVGYASGYRLPVDDLCELAHRRGALVFLDAIQGLGVFSLDLARTPVDFLAADGHKWMLGPEGAGIAFVRRAHLDLLHCASVGWNSVTGSDRFSGERMRLRESAARFEGGSANVFGLMALHSSLQLFWEVLEAHGPEAIGDRVLELHRYAVEAVRRLGLELLSDWQRANRSGIVTFQPRQGTPEECRARLAEAGIAVSCRGGGVRISLHAYNTPQEIDRLAECLQA